MGPIPLIYGAPAPSPDLLLAWPPTDRASFPFPPALSSGLRS